MQPSSTSPSTDAVTVALHPLILLTRDLARNEEFSEIAVIHIFFTVLKNKTVICGGGGSAGKISR